MDGQGRELSATATPVDDYDRYTVGLIEPVYPGERHSYVRVTDCPNAAEREGDVWSYSAARVESYGTNEFVETVVLPEGAEIVSTEPWPVARFDVDEQPVLRFAAKRGCDEQFRFTVRYRLPAEPSR